MGHPGLGGALPARGVACPRAGAVRMDLPLSPAVVPAAQSRRDHRSGRPVPQISNILFGNVDIFFTPGLAPEPVRFFPFFDTAVTMDQVFVYARVLAILVLGALMLRFTDAGLSVRAMVDSEAMTSLSGTDPSWMALVSGSSRCSWPACPAFWLPRSSALTPLSSRGSSRPPSPRSSRPASEACPSPSSWVC